ncbi:MAG: hypothetical protein ACN4GG_07720 [Akkermansiaceae bacterium]
MTLKPLFSLALIGLLSTAFAEKRTWLSADYEREMEAEFLSTDGKTVTINRNGHILTFLKSRLSEDDIEWIDELSKPLPELPELSIEEFAASDFGKALAASKKLKNDTFVSAPFAPIPKLFLLYYSASW